ncbi:hypothetical protein CkaCkLH20_05214 [Colletotrichum karsti]|uniref:Uncharacterized protein n=1 Tax=Colletotrichum karsti TaxID=1095194 RepID=A0A9P6LIP4_9PEZI|nr:uncharacterized protein CkaCkLH20_05214 [Colletotrichum karsti]KAF9877514.1 hypothetical protein CkaCkLH20_05214 [Colletotrichum karsti]
MSPWDGVGNPIRFKEWYSSFGPVFQNISTGVCNETLAAYLADYKSLTTKTCDFHVDCVLGEVSESIKAKNASAAIFLGILPSMLAMLGPSMTQLALLSTRRPLLSLLIALGSVGFYLDRLFRLETPTEILSMVQGERLIPRLRSSRWGFVVSVLEYLVVATAVLNVLNMAVRVGDRTIMSFRCNMWSLPLIWVTSLAGIFFLVAIPFQFSAVAKHMRNCTGDGTRSSVDAGPEGLGDTQWTPLPPRPEWTRREQHPGAPNGALERRSTADSVSQFVAREFTPGMRHPSLRVHEIPQFEPWVAVLFNVGFFFAAFHIIIGTCWLSSTLFLSPGDAIRIVLRFFGSAVVCRFVVMVELASMKSQEMPQGEK